MPARGETTGNLPIASAWHHRSRYFLAQPDLSRFLLEDDEQGDSSGYEGLKKLHVPVVRNDYSSSIASTPALRECQGPDYGGWPQMGRWLLPFICRAKAYRQSRCCIRPDRQCLPRSNRHAIPAEGSVPCLK